MKRQKPPVFPAVFRLQCFAMERFLEFALTAVASLWIGSFLGSYMKKKGENRAIREDLDQLIEQMRAVTQATKEIESKISNDVWERQKRWEIKRDTLFELVKRLHAMQDALLFLNSTFTVVKQSPTPHLLAVRKSEAVDSWKQASTGFESAEVQAYLVCDQSVRNAVHSAGLLLRRVAKEIFAEDLKHYYQRLPEMVAAAEQVSAAIRRELRIDLEPTSQSSESSPAQGPVPQAPK